MIFLGLAAGVFCIDFFLKRYVEQHYEKKVRNPKCGNLFYIEKYYNNGAMLNALERHTGLLKVLHTGLMLLLCIWFYFSLRSKEKKIQNIGLALLIGGGMSNLFDRYTKGHVVDYIGFGFGPKWFRNIIFNSSDFFVFIGAALTILSES